MSYQSPTARGFFVDVDDENRRITVRFDLSKISGELSDWKNMLTASGNIDYDTDYIPYWGFDDVYHKAGVKLGNCFYVSADIKKEGGVFFCKYSEIMQLSWFSLDRFLCCIREGNILIDFDARSGHNHGTKFRVKQNAIPSLYENIHRI